LRFVGAGDLGGRFQGDDIFFKEKKGGDWDMFEVTHVSLEFFW